LHRELVAITLRQGLNERESRQKYLGFTDVGHVKRHTARRNVTRYRLCDTSATIRNRNGLAYAQSRNARCVAGFITLDRYRNRVL
jgi:hypothetical protein